MSTPSFFDVHTHTHFAAFKDDSDAVIARALDAGVWMINVGTQRDTSEGAIATAERHEEGVYASVGLHPIHTEQSHHDAKELGVSFSASSPLLANSHELAHKGMEGFVSRGEEFDYEEYKKLALHPKVVAIGECGLDYYRLREETKKKQQETFVRQIELAHEVGKPLMIHCRNAFPDLISLLKTTRPNGHSSGRKNYQLKTTNHGIIHFFTGTVEDAKALLAMGFSFSFGGVITFAREYDEVLRYIPLDRIVSETDAPYVAPEPYRGKRNEPLYVREVVKKIAEVRLHAYEEVEQSLFENARNLFSLPG